MKTIFICIIIQILWGVPVFAEDNLKFSKWIGGFEKEALAEGISPAVIKRTLAGIKYNKLVIKLDRNQPEFKLSFQNYLDRTVSEIRIKKGQEKLRENFAVLSEIARIYGVPPRFMVALWGIETDFGRVTGSFPIIESLATLSFDPRRSAFFKKELLAVLHIVNNGYIPLQNLEGSWAGAMGYLQFLPSVFLKHRVDYNNDGQVSIWESSGDLFGTGANYLAKSGWMPKWTWGREVTIPNSLQKGLLGLDKKMDLAKWQEIGVRRKSGEDLPEVTLNASLIQPDHDEKRFFLIYNNFRVLMKWNRSTYYAVAVGLLADQLKNGKTIN